MAKPWPSLGKEIDAMKKIVMYSSDYCPFCHAAKTLLNKKGFAFEEINVDGDRQVRQEMINKAGRTSVPQIWIGDQHIGGCDELHALERSQQLDALMSQE